MAGGSDHLIHIGTTEALEARVLEQIAAVDSRVRMHEPGSFSAIEILLFGWRRLSPEILARAPRLRWAHCLSAGVDPMFSALMQHPVEVTATRGIHGDTMAEHAYLLLLALAHGFAGDMRRQARGCWQSHDVTSLRGMRLGVVGTGSIGREILARAQAFGLDGYAFNRSGVTVPCASHTFPIAALGEQLPGLDALVLVCPLTSETTGMIDAAALARMKPSVLLVNVGRGELIDEAALIDALQANRLGGVALDVTATEPLPAESPLWSFERVLITPHVGGRRTDYTEVAVQSFCRNLERYLRKQPLLDRVAKSRGW